MNGKLEVGILEVDQEHEVILPNRPQNRTHHLHHELGEDDISVETRQVDRGS